MINDYSISLRAEETWWNLTSSERVYYERCITSIIAYYAHERGGIQRFVRYAYRYYGSASLVMAVIWRLQEELSND